MTKRGDQQRASRNPDERRRLLIKRRELLRGVGGLGPGMAFVGSLDTVFGRSAVAATPMGEAYGYGPLVPDPARILAMPAAFTYRTFSNAATSHRGPRPLPPRRHVHLPRPGRNLRLVRNHEITRDGVWAPADLADLTCDPPAFGGTMTLELDDDLNLVSQYGSLGGTVRNCAGGRTPWGTRLTGEETELRKGRWVKAVTLDQGPRLGLRSRSAPSRRQRLADSARRHGGFAHEAVAIDPETNVAYLTEDAARPFGLLYRFTPADASGGYGSYRSGGLPEAMHVPGVRDLSTVDRISARFNDVEWVPVTDPAAVSVPTRLQFSDDQVTRNEKLEGA